jgi:uncharacterized membrane protein
MNTKAFFYFLTGILFLPLVITAQTYSFLREISGNTQQPGLYDFQQPQDLTVDIEGNVFVLDQNYIVKFNSSGSFLKK